MITEDEYDRIQVLLGRRSKPRSKKHQFAYRGPILCGECGAMVTAEHKRKIQKNGNIHEYIYYHCTKQKKVRCSQRSIEAKELEKQIENILVRIEIPYEFYEWAMDVLRERNKEEFEIKERGLTSIRRRYDSCINKLDKLIDMRASGEISEEEFLRSKLVAVEQRLKL